MSNPSVLGVAPHSRASCWIEPLFDRGFRPLSCVANPGLAHTFKVERIRDARIFSVTVLHATKPQHLLPNVAFDSPYILKTEEILFGRSFGPGFPGVPCYLVSEYVDGMSLATRLVGGHGALTVVEAIRIVRDIAMALEHIHCHGQRYPDLLPHNVFLAAGGRTLLTHFGLFRACSGCQPLPHCMAPESFCLDYKIDDRADIYSLGMVSYAAIAGHYAYDRESYVEAGAKHCLEPLPSLRDERPDALPYFEGFLRRCTAKNPARRFATMKEVTDELTRMLELYASPETGSAERRGAAPSYSEQYDIPPTIRECGLKLTRLSEREGHSVPFLRKLLASCRHVAG